MAVVSIRSFPSSRRCTTGRPSSSKLSAARSRNRFLDSHNVEAGSTDADKVSVPLGDRIPRPSSACQQTSGRPPLRCRFGKSPREGLRQRLGRRGDALGD